MQVLEHNTLYISQARNISFFICMSSVKKIHYGILISQYFKRLGLVLQANRKRLHPLEEVRAATRWRRSVPSWRSASHSQERHSRRPVCPCAPTERGSPCGTAVWSSCHTCWDRQAASSLPGGRGACADAGSDRCWIASCICRTATWLKKQMRMAKWRRSHERDGIPSGVELRSLPLCSFLWVWYADQVFPWKGQPSSSQG